MKRKFFLKPATRAFFSSLITLVLLVLIGYFFKFPVDSWFNFILVLLIQLVLTFFFYRFWVDRIVFRRLDMIYKVIYEKTKALDPKTKQKPDLALTKIRAEVENWLENYEQNHSSSPEVKDAAEFRRQFLGDVAHELKTPIFNIQGYIITLLDGGLEDPLINYDYLKRCEKSIDRMISLVEDLETINKYDSRDIPLHYTNFDFSKLVKDSFLDFEMIAEEARVDLIFRNDSENTYVCADKNQIRQVLHNLINNAIRYRGEVDPYIKITLADDDAEGKLLVTVADNGIGVSEADIPRLFERFYRADKGRSRQKGGTGLGLSIVKHIIKAHNEKLFVESTLGKGTAFNFTLAKVEKPE